METIKHLINSFGENWWLLGSAIRSGLVDNKTDPNYPPAQAREDVTSWHLRSARQIKDYFGPSKKEAAARKLAEESAVLHGVASGGSAAVSSNKRGRPEEGLLLASESSLHPSFSVVVPAGFDEVPDPKARRLAESDELGELEDHGRESSRSGPPAVSAEAIGVLLRKLVAPGSSRGLLAEFTRAPAQSSDAMEVDDVSAATRYMAPSADVQATSSLHSRTLQATFHNSIKSATNSIQVVRFTNEQRIRSKKLSGASLTPVNSANSLGAPSIEPQPSTRSLLGALSSNMVCMHNSHEIAVKDSASGVYLDPLRLVVKSQTPLVTTNSTSVPVSIGGGGSAAGAAAAVIGQGMVGIGAAAHADSSESHKIISASHLLTTGGGASGQPQMSNGSILGSLQPHIPGVHPGGAASAGVVSVADAGGAGGSGAAAVGAAGGASYSGSMGHHPELLRSSVVGGVSLGVNQSVPSGSIPSVQLANKYVPINPGNRAVSQGMPGQGTPVGTSSDSSNNRGININHSSTLGVGGLPGLKSLLNLTQQHPPPATANNLGAGSIGGTIIFGSNTPGAVAPGRPSGPSVMAPLPPFIASNSSASIIPESGQSNAASFTPGKGRSIYMYVRII